MMQLKVMQLVVILSLAMVAIEASPEGRILGGTEAEHGALPYAASLRVDSAHVCGASILSETKLLTAAHCLHRSLKKIEVSRITSRVGSTNQYAGGQIIHTDSYVIHPGYNNLDNNLAIITLATPLTWSDRVKPIELIGQDDALPAVGAAVDVAGWGSTEEDAASFKIRQLSLKFAAEDVCLDAYEVHDAAKDFCLTHALKEGTCNGDGGGAAVYNGKLLGISNFVVGACGSRYPDVFVRTSGYVEWIQKQMLA